MTAAERSPWQDQDGFPTADYFFQVLAALTAAGVEVIGSYREEPWEWNAQIGGTTWPDLWVSWRCDESDAPDHAGDFTGLAWYWVPYSNPQGPGDRAEKFTELGYLADPAAVASAVAELAQTYRKPGMTPAEERLAAIALLRERQAIVHDVAGAVADVLEQSVWEDGEVVGDVPGFLDDAIEALARAILASADQPDTGRPA